MELADVLDKIDRSDLSFAQEEGFTNWLSERPPMQESIVNAFGKGRSIKALVVSKSPLGKADYIVRVKA